MNVVANFFFMQINQCTQNRAKWYEFFSGIAVWTPKIRNFCDQPELFIIYLPQVSILYQSYHHQSKSWESARSGEYTFQIFLKNDLLLASVSSDDRKVLLLTEYRCQVPVSSAELLDLCRKEVPLFSATYRKVKVIPGAFEFSLLPAKVFNRNHTRELASILISEDDRGRHVAFAELAGGDAVAVYTFPETLRQKLREAYGNVEYIPFCQSATAMAMASNGNASKSLFVNIFQGHFVLTGIRAGKLHLCNAYPYSGPTDIVYFLQLVADILGFSGEFMPVVVTGEFEPDSQLILQLKKHIPGIRIPGKELATAFEDGPGSPPAWKYAFMTW